MKVFEVEFGDFVKESGLRNDFKFIDWWRYPKRQYKSTIRLRKTINSYYKGFAFKGDDFTKGGDVSVLKGVNFNADFSINFDNIEYLPNDFNKYSKYKKFKVNRDDVIVSLVGSIGKIVLVDSSSEMLLNQNNIALRPNKNLYDLKFYTYLLSFTLKEMITKIHSNSGYSFLRIEDLFNLNLPLIPKETQDKIVAKIEPIENKIKELKEKIKQPQEVINKVFAREFGFDLEKFEKLKKVKHYYLDLSNFGNNIDLRQSVKFHRDAGKFVIDALKKLSTKKIKDFIAEPIVLGKSVSPKDYDEGGEFHYISMANIKNWKFESEGSNLVSTNYSNQNQNKTVRKNDILIARSGEGTIGKVALINDEELQGIFADFTMRMRLKDYNPLFAYYYFRTPYFQYLVEVNKKGLGNNTNIFPSQIRELPIIDIPLPEQQKIVDEIKLELDKQEAIKEEIADQRNKIDDLITESLAA